MKGIASSAYKVNRDHLELMLDNLSIPVYLGAHILKVEGGKITFIQENKQVTLSFDMVSECVGLKSNHLELDWDGELLTVGDADHPDNVMNAVWQAYRQCRLV